ncbi:MAG: hypothetical protein LBI42_09440 [Chitinispirillales bacterium]|nr:hypothetical protein [Chitinispirillales bacterium]
MSLTKGEIIGLASRYIPESETADFTFNGDLFALLIRDILQNRVLKDEEGWAFGGYGQCLQYTIDEDVKPRGKWLWMHFVSLQDFPPAPQVIRLQPPHVIKGTFQTPDRAQEIRILKINFSDILPNMHLNESSEEKTAAPPLLPSSKNGGGDNIIQFKKRKTGGKKS